MNAIQSYHIIDMSKSSSSKTSYVLALFCFKRKIIFVD